MQEAAEQPLAAPNGSDHSIEKALEDAIVRLQPSDAAAEALRRFARTPAESSSHYPRKKTAAVLVLLSVQNGELTVLLTTRALTLRTSPGETAFPGGRVEGDEDVNATALREAREEVALPQTAPLLHLTTLPAFLSYTLLFVIPVVYLLDSKNADEVLNALVPAPAEVSSIFTAEVSRFRGNDAIQQSYKHSHHDLTWLADKPFRLHSFQDASFASDVTGLTADILLSVAEIAAGDQPAFERRAPNQLSWKELVQHVLDGKDSRPRR